MEDLTVYRDNRNRSLGMVHLRREAHAAYLLWLNRWHARVDRQLNRSERAELPAAKFAAHDDTCAALAEFVLTDAATAALPPHPGEGDHYTARSAAEFAAAQRIRAEHDRLDPPAPTAVLAWDDSETCRHGVSIDADCQQCDED